MAADVPKGTRLDFAASGKLNGTAVVAAQKGTTVSVESLFHNLPVRRRELERNIKREWNKMLALLNQYACIQTGLKFTVSQQPSKGKRVVLFSTKGNPTTRENIINVFGAKTINALVALDLQLDLQPSNSPKSTHPSAKGEASRQVRVSGHVSRPTIGDGRQTPDRQMFYVNGRPCGLPQFAKLFNEVYRSYNSSQSPFVFADVQLDTHLYDVNVSPDKRTILLHDQGRMLENLREALAALFESQDYTVPISQPTSRKQLALSEVGMINPKVSRTVIASPNAASNDAFASQQESSEDKQGVGLIALSNSPLDHGTRASDLLRHWVGRKSTPRQEPAAEEHSTIERRLSEADGLEAICQRKCTTDNNAHNLSPDKHEQPFACIEKSGSNVQSLSEEATDRLEETVKDTQTSSLQGADGAEHSGDVGYSLEKEQDSAGVIVPGPLPFSSVPQKRTAENSRDVLPNNEPATTTMPLSPKRARVEDMKPRHRAREPSVEDQISTAIPSFVGRLTQIFSADASPQAKSTLAVEALVVTPRASSSAVDTFVSDSESATWGSGDKDGEMTEAAHIDGTRIQASAPNSLPGVGEKAIEETQTNLRPNDAEASGPGVIVEVPPPEPAEKRSQALRSNAKRKEATLRFEQQLHTDEESIKQRLASWTATLTSSRATFNNRLGQDSKEVADPEEKLSLTILRSDFGQMKIVGQFNLGFILAVRYAANDGGNGAAQRDDDELFIVDQHASDEKFNFERLQETTVVQSQRLVHPKRLDLTAMEEEIIAENLTILEKNGFKVQLDESGDEPVGSRCQLLALPLSRETTFTLADLEELVSILGEGASQGCGIVPRPSKVRKMFAMRACRSSVMIGKALPQKQMEKLVRHMGELDKPWNCPHGRPTMRHLCSLGGLNEKGRVGQSVSHHNGSSKSVWVKYLAGGNEMQ
jgi:DNA mismatch repair protein PMS2